MVILTELILIIQGIVLLLVHCTASPMDYMGYVIGLEALSILLLLLRTPIEVWLEEREDKEVKRSCAATNPQTPVAILQRLSENHNPNVRKDVATNINVPVSILKKLAQDKNAGVRLAVAQNITMPLPFLEDTPVLERLAKDRCPDVRFAMADNGSPKMPAAILEHLSQDRNPDVRYAVARNKRTPDYVLAMLAKDKNRNVRLEVANNKRTPDYILDEILSKDKDWEISLAVLKRESSRT